MTTTPPDAAALAEEFARKVSPQSWRSKDEGGRGYSLDAAIKESLNTAQRILAVQFGDALCQECGKANPVWHAPHDLWNSVMGGEGGVLCPTCFCAALMRAKPSHPYGSSDAAAAPRAKPAGEVVEGTAAICGQHHNPYCRDCVAAYDSNTDRILTHPATTESDGLRNTSEWVKRSDYDRLYQQFDAKCRIINEQAALAQPTPATE